MKSMIQFCKKEAVLSIAVVLALLSVFFVRRDIWLILTSGRWEFCSA